MDYTSDHAFQVQKWGDDTWTDPAVGITGEGTDKNGKTWDITMEVPSEQCVVRGSMMVTPMGRSVVFYLYPDNYTEGSSDGVNGFKPAMVTKESGKTAAARDSSADQTEAEENSTEASEDAKKLQAEAVQTDAEAADAGAGDSEAENTESGVTGDANAGAVDMEAGSVAVDKDAGLKLSTEQALSGTDDGSAQGAETDADSPHSGQTRSAGEQILINVVSGVLIGSILLAVCLFVLFAFRKKIGIGPQEDPEEYDELYK